MNILIFEFSCTPVSSAENFMLCWLDGVTVCCTKAEKSYYLNRTDYDDGCSAFTNT